MARKVNIKDTRQPRTIVVGAGITEYWYLTHLKRMCGFQYILKPSLFGDESMETIQRRITDGVESGATVVCVFDEDVSQWNDKEKGRLQALHNKYDSSSQVVLASSMPSIEYWLLLHFEKTNKYFGTSSKVMEVLRKHLPGFDKKEQYLKQEKWVMPLLESPRMDEAYKRAKAFGTRGESFSSMWKAIDNFENAKNK